MVGVGRALWGHPAQPPAQAGSPTAGCTAPRPGGAGISPEKETPQPLWAAWCFRQIQHELVRQLIEKHTPTCSSKSWKYHRSPWTCFPAVKRTSSSCCQSPQGLGSPAAVEPSSRGTGRTAASPSSPTSSGKENTGPRDGLYNTASQRPTGTSGILWSNRVLR